MTSDWDDEAFAILTKVAGIELREEQEAYLEEACDGDPALRKRVERLLGVYQQAGSFLDAPAVPTTAWYVNYSPSDSIGTQIGAYKILQEIGEGGFGVVYMAEQQRPVRRKVALKIIKPGMDSREVIARFEAEQQALAMMDHPNIARVLDAGTTNSGRPYFAMELVKGVPITEYCDKNQMPLAARLKLFVTVCQAVQHAHQKGVIHRDIKPSNIMVTLHDGKPVPKVIDFGVAKAISQQLTERTLFTQYGQMIGTPQYMSPEQAEISGLDVDTRSDIYSLGVLLYEMLTGTTPLTAEQLRASGFAEIQRAICESEAPTPSTRLSTLGDELTVIASHRQSDAHKLRQLLHGELDWIVMKSLDKDRARRYETAGAFADDIEAYLHDEPVQARPPSVTYLLGKTLRKHRALAITSATVAAILLVATAISTWQAVRAHKESRIAEDAKALAEANLEKAILSEQKAQTEAENAKTARRTTEQLKEKSEREKDKANQKAYVAEMYHASQAYARGDMGEMNNYLNQQLPELRDFAWYHWWLAGHLHRELIYDATMKWNLVSSPDGELVAVGAMPQTTRLYRTKDAVLVAELSDSVGTPAFSPDGTLVVTHDIQGKMIKIWRTANGALVHTLDGNHDESITATAFSPARSLPLFAAADESGRITVWDASQWRIMGTISHTVEFGDQRRATAVRGLTFASAGDTLVAGADSGDVVVYDVATRERALDLKHARGIKAVAYSPRTGILATSAAESVKLWDSEFHLIASLKDLPPISALAFSSDGKRLAAGTSKNNSILIWDLSPGEPRVSAKIRGHLEEVVGVGFGPPEKNTVWSASRDLSIRAWDLDKCEPFEKLDFRSPEGSRLMYTDDNTLMIVRNGDSLRRWAIEQRDWLPLQKDEKKYSSAAVSDDGAVLAGVASNSLCVWSLNDPTPRTVDLEDYDLPWQVRSFPRPLAVTRDGLAVAISVDGESQWNSGLVVLDTSTGNQRCRIPSGTDLGWASGWACVFSPDGNRLAVRRVDRIELWELSGDRPIPEHSFQGHSALRCATFSPDGHLIAVGSDSQYIDVFDIATGRRKTLSGHTSGVNDLAFSPDGTFLLSGGDDGTVRMWETATGRQLSTYTGHRVAVTSVAISPSVESFASRDGDGTIRIWNRSTAADVRQNADAVLMNASDAGFQEDLPPSIDWKGTLSSLDWAINNCPNNWKLYRKRGDFYRVQRNWDKAISDYDTAIELGPDDGVMYQRRADMHLRAGQRGKAVQDLVKAIQLSPLVSSPEHLRQIQDSLNLGEEVVPETAEWNYTTLKPPENWAQSTFDDSRWPVGQAPFGLDATILGLSLERRPNQLWWETDIWLRHTIDRNEISKEPLVLNAFVNDYADVFLNGVRIAQLEAKPKEGEISTNWWEGAVQLSEDTHLLPGRNVLAVHCRDRFRFFYGKIDIGLYVRAENDSAFENVLEGALRLSPDRPELLRGLANQSIRRSNWDNAIIHYDKLVDLTPSDANVGLQAAALLVYTNNMNGYHQLCAKLLDRYTDSGDAVDAAVIARACLIAPPKESALPAILKLADKGLTAENGWFVAIAQVTKALAEYRLGDSQVAIERAQKSLERSNSHPVSRNAAVFRLAYCVKALAHIHQSEFDLARKDLLEFQQFLKSHSPIQRGDQLGDNWDDWLICEILSRAINQQMPESKE